MPLQDDIYTALSSVAGGRVYPQIAPQEEPLPLVVWRISGKNPLSALGGHQGMTQYAVVFECWGRTHTEAISVALAVESAIDASALTSWRDNASGEDFEPALDAFMEPVFYGFWYST